MSTKAIPFTFAGPLDLRTPPGQMPFGALRRRLNVRLSDQGKPVRADGFRKFLHSDAYGNEDLHDQMLPLSDDLAAAREAITFGMEVVSNEGVRHALVGTRSRLYELNQSEKTWRIIHDAAGQGAGSYPIRWQAAASNNTVVFTNDWDIPVSYTLDDPTDASGQATRSIASLGLIQLEKAGTVFVFKDYTIFGNVVLGGKRYSNTLVWSQRFKPTQMDPATTNATQDQALDSGEKVMRGIAFKDYAMVFTDRGIYQGQATGDANMALSFTKIYHSREGDRCLAFPNTLVNTGEQLVWMGRNGVTWTLQPGYEITPTKPQWMDGATQAITSDMNSASCDSHCAGYFPERKEVWLSWTPAGGTVPTRTLVFNMEWRYVDERPYGATCYFTFRSDPRITLRDWLRTLCVCTLADLADAIEKEGLIASTSTCSTAPTNFLTSTTQTINGETTEDWSVAVPEAGTFAALIDGIKTDALCGECNEAQIFAFAHSHDNCLKQVDGTYAHEMCLNYAVQNALDGDDNYTPVVGSYLLQGYYSVLLSGPLFADTDFPKTIEQFVLDHLPEVSAGNCVFSLRVGQSYAALDPRLQITDDTAPIDPSAASGCDVMWQNSQRRALTCPQTLTGQQYQARNITPALGTQWKLYANARCLYIELTIAALSDTANYRSNLLPATGGGVTLAGATLFIRRA